MKQKLTRGEKNRYYKYVGDKYMPDIREITEEKIFKTLGRGVPMCTTNNEQIQIL